MGSLSWELALVIPASTMINDESCSCLDSRGQSTVGLASLVSLFKQKGSLRYYESGTSTMVSPALY